MNEHWKEEYEGESICRPGGNYGLCKTHPTCEMVRERLAAAEAREQRLRAALELYGRHQPDCAYRWGSRTRCDCGYHAALDATAGGEASGGQ